MIEKLHLSTILFIAAVVWSGLLLFEGVPVSPAWFHPFSRVVGVLMILLTAFDLWLWRLRWLRGWLVKRPLIDGTWSAKVVSNYKDPETAVQIEPISGFMVIRQTFSRLSLCLITKESRSELLGAEVVRAADGSYRVFGVYRNEPRFSVRHRSEIHYGGLELQATGAVPDRMEGHYWTDRSTAGEILLSGRKKAARPRYAFRAGAFYTGVGNAKYCTSYT